MPIFNFTGKGGDRSGSSVVTEPFDHLIQHIKQYDVRLYEALKRIPNLQENITNILNTLDRPLQPVKDPEKIRAIIPGVQVVADDIMANRYTVKIDEDKKIVLELCSITAKTSPPTGGDYEIDWLRSQDESVTFISLFPSGDRPILPLGKHKIKHVKFAIVELFNDDELRFDVKQANGAENMESVLKGKIVDK